MFKIVVDARESGTSTGRYIDKLVEYLHLLIAVEHLGKASQRNEATSQIKNNQPDPQYNITILTKKHRLEYLKQIAPNFTILETPYQEFTFGEQLGFKKQLQSLQPDLVHFGMVQQPIWYKGLSVTTMHDLTTLRFNNPAKNPVVFKLKQQVYKWVNKQAAHKSAQIITPSEFVKNDIVKYTGINPDKITVTPESADKITASAEPYPVSKNTTAEPDKAVEPGTLAQPVATATRNPLTQPVATTTPNPLAQTQAVTADKPKTSSEPYPAEPESLPTTNKPYLLYVGRPQPHKNLKRLIDAYAIVKQTQPQLQLVLAGKLDAAYQLLQTYAQKQGIEGILFTGWVTDGQLRWLYEQATAYVFPSLSEGFGLPGLEAMHYDLPVISSNATCLPEVYGQAAVYFDPLDTQDIANTINRVLEDQKLRTELIEKGQQQLKNYSWQKMAEQTLDVYKNALKQSL